MTDARTPVAATPPRMEPLARLPVFLALEGKRAVVAGGDAAAAWKTELLSAAGAQVDVYAAEASEELAALAARPPRGLVTVFARAWESPDFTSAAIAVGGCEDEAEAARFAAAARRGRRITTVSSPRPGMKAPPSRAAASRWSGPAPAIRNC